MINAKKSNRQKLNEYLKNRGFAEFDDSEMKALPNLYNDAILWITHDQCIVYDFWQIVEIYSDKMHYDIEEATQRCELMIAELFSKDVNKKEPVILFLPLPLN